MSKKIRLGLPKGSLQDATIALFQKAGINVEVSHRCYFPKISDQDIECILLRVQEMSEYVERGILDCAITGEDWLLENGSHVKELVDLNYSKNGFGKVRWVVATNNDSDICSLKDLNNKTIACEAVNLANSFLKKNNINADIIFSWGATEAKPPLICDAIIEITETGDSLEANNLRVIDTVLESGTKFIANIKSYSDPVKKKKIDFISESLRSAVH